MTVGLTKRYSSDRIENRTPVLFVLIKGDISKMTDREKELLTIVREHNDPEQALTIAIHTIVEFLKQDESSQEPLPACPPELV